jgi:hypothetical protein
MSAGYRWLVGPRDLVFPDGRECGSGMLGGRIEDPGTANARPPRRGFFSQGGAISMETMEEEGRSGDDRPGGGLLKPT